LQAEDAVCVYIHGDTFSVSSPPQQSLINGWQVTGKMCFKWSIYIFQMYSLPVCLTHWA